MAKRAVTVEIRPSLDRDQHLGAHRVTLRDARTATSTTTPALDLDDMLEIAVALLTYVKEQLRAEE